MKTKQTNPTRIYRTVECSERLPETEGMYITSTGLMSFSKTFNWINQHNYTIKAPDWWLEEVELPSEEDIFNSTPHYRNDPELDDAFEDGYSLGASFILNHIKG